MRVTSFPGPRITIEDPRDEHLREVMIRLVEGGALTEVATSGAASWQARAWSLSLRMAELLGDALDGAEVAYDVNFGWRISR